MKRVAAALIALGAPLRAGAEVLDYLELRAQMALSCQISVESAPVAVNLDLSRSEDQLLVASIRETCNAPAGYTVTLSSLGEGRFHPEGSFRFAERTGPTIPYRLHYGGAPAPLAGGRGHPAQVSDTRGRTGALGVRKEVSISYRPVSNAEGGAYSDVLVFTITPR